MAQDLRANECLYICDFLKLEIDYKKKEKKCRFPVSMIDLGKPHLEIRKTAGGAQEVEAYSRLCGCEDALTRGPRPGGRGPPPTLQTS